MAKQTNEVTSYGLVLVLNGTWEPSMASEPMEALITSGRLSFPPGNHCGYWTPYGATPLAQRMAEVSERARKEHKPAGPCQIVTLAPDRWLLVDAIA